MDPFCLHKNLSHKWPFLRIDPLSSRDDQMEVCTYIPLINVQKSDKAGVVTYPNQERILAFGVISFGRPWNFKSFGWLHSLLSTS